MTILTLELAPDLLQQLKQEAERTGQSVETVAATVLREHVPNARPQRYDVDNAPSEAHARLREALQSAGLLTDLGPELQKRAESSTATLEDVQAAFARAGGVPLSEIVLEQHGRQ